MKAKQPFEHGVESDFHARTPELCKPESPVYTQETARQDCSLFLPVISVVLLNPGKLFRRYTSHRTALKVQETAAEFALQKKERTSLKQAVTPHAAKTKVVDYCGVFA